MKLVKLAACTALPEKKLKKLRDKLARLERRLENRKLAGKPFNANAHLNMRQRQLAIRATLHEKTLYRKLVSWGFSPQFQKGFIAGGVCYIADLYLPKPYKLVIEVDGDSHLTREGIERDAKRDAYFQRRGFRVLHITNTQVETLTREQFNLDSYEEGTRKSLRYGYFDTSHILRF